MEVNKIIEQVKFGEVTAVTGDIIDIHCNSELLNSNKTILDYFSQICSKEKFVKALPVLELNEQILNHNISNSSNSLKNKLLIIEALVNNDDTYIFKDVHKSLSYREKENVKRILKKLAEHNKKVIVMTNDVEFLFNLTKTVLVINEEQVINLSPINWLDDNLYNYVSKPPIIEFVSNLKKRNIKIDNCYETKELLKAIYRSVDK